MEVGHGRSHWTVEGERELETLYYLPPEAAAGFPAAIGLLELDQASPMVSRRKRIPLFESTPSPRHENRNRYISTSKISQLQIRPGTRERQYLSSIVKTRDAIQPQEIAGVGSCGLNLALNL